MDKYTEKNLGEGRYQLKYVDGSNIEMDTVQTFWHRRASEICQSKEYSSKKMSGYRIQKAYDSQSGWSAWRSPVVQGVIDCINVDRETPSWEYLSEKGEENPDEFEKWEFRLEKSRREKEEEKGK